MEKLSQELVDHISSFLDIDDLKNTLLLSHYFQCSAEKYREKLRPFVLTAANADKAINFYSGRRFFYLRNVHFYTSFPELDAGDLDLYEKKDKYGNRINRHRDTADDLRTMDEDFTQQIQFLFRTLHTIESRSGNSSNAGNISLTIFTPTRKIDRWKWGPLRMNVSWRVHLLSPENLPNLASIRTFTVQRGDIGYEDLEGVVRKLDSRVILDLSKKLPNLGLLKCNIGVDDWSEVFADEYEDLKDTLEYLKQAWAGPRRDDRHDFGKALDGLALPHLHHAHLDFLHFHSACEDQREQIPNVQAPEIYDPFSNSLRLLSYQLRTMKLRVVADKTLFWPADGSIPFWPNLESIHVMFHMSTPSGTWYFNGPQDLEVDDNPWGYELGEDESSYPPLADTDRDDYNCSKVGNWDLGNKGAETFAHRVEPNEEVLVPFLTAFAKSASQMPSLQEYSLWSPLSFSYDGGDRDSDSSQAWDGQDASWDLAWGIAYTAPQTKVFAVDPGLESALDRQMWWRVGDWRPDTNLHELFQQVGRKRHGEGLLEYFSNRGLDSRGDFESWGWGVCEE